MYGTNRAANAVSFQRIARMRRGGRTKGQEEERGKEGEFVEGDNILMQELHDSTGRKQVCYNIIVNGQILAQYKRVYPSTDSVVCFYLDYLGSRRVVANAAGTAIDRYRYSAWGNATRDAGSDDYRSFTGKEYDATGLIYFNARYYDPMTGRFLTEDPARKGISWYLYCNNNPVNAIDPKGKIIKWVQGQNVSDKQFTLVQAEANKIMKSDTVAGRKFSEINNSPTRVLTIRIESVGDTQVDALTPSDTGNKVGTNADFSFNINEQTGNYNGE